MKLRPSLAIPAAAIALALTQAVSASVVGSQNFFVVTPNIAPLATNYTSNVMWDENTATNVVVGYQRSNSGSLGGLVWTYDSGSGAFRYIGIEPSGANSDYQSSSNTGTYNAYNTLTSNGISNAVIQPNAINSAGVVIGNVARFNTAVALGSDNWVYLPNTAASSTITTAGSGGTGITVYTPTIVNLRGDVADSNGDSVTSHYSYNVTVSAGNVHSFEVGNVNSSNSSGSVVGTSARYTSASNSVTLGQDVYLSSGGSTIALGLGVSNSATGYRNTATGSRTSNLVANSNNYFVPNAASINNAGSVVGATTSYPNNAATGGTDVWLYTAGSTALNGTTVQIGLVGNSNNSNTITSADGTTVAYFQGTNATGSIRTSAVTNLTNTTATFAHGLVGGTQIVYSAATGAVNSGTIAWIYNPNGTPGTGTAVASGALSAGAYTQVGLQDLGTSTVAGHRSSSGFGISAIVGLNNSGHAAGTSTRYLSTSGIGTTGAGTSAFYYDGSSSINLEPTYLTANGTNQVSPTGLVVRSVDPSNNGLTNLSAAPVNPTTPTTTSAGTNYSNYVDSNGKVTQSVTTMNAAGTFVGGSITRVASSTGTSTVGTDAWVYDTTSKIEYIITSPTINLSSGSNAAGTTGNVTITSINDYGLVAGFYSTAYNSSNGSSSTGIATYVFEWSEGNGFVTIDQTGGATNPTTQAYSSSLTSPGVSYAIGDQTNKGVTNLTAPALGSSLVLLGNNTALFASDSTAALTGTNIANSTPNGIVEILPEPASLGILGLGGLFLARRRRS